MAGSTAYRRNDHDTRRVDQAVRTVRDGHKRVSRLVRRRAC